MKSKTISRNWNTLYLQSNVVFPVYLNHQYAAKLSCLLNILHHLGLSKAPFNFGREIDRHSRGYSSCDSLRRILHLLLPHV